jgi:hypothetical protein
MVRKGMVLLLGAYFCAISVVGCESDSTSPVPVRGIPKDTIAVLDLDSILIIAASDDEALFLTDSTVDWYRKDSTHLSFDLDHSGEISAFQIDDSRFLVTPVTKTHLRVLGMVNRDSVVSFDDVNIPRPLGNLSGLKTLLKSSSDDRCGYETKQIQAVEYARDAFTTIGLLSTSLPAARLASSGLRALSHSVSQLTAQHIAFEATKCLGGASSEMVMIEKFSGFFGPRAQVVLCAAAGPAAPFCLAGVAGDKAVDDYLEWRTREAREIREQLIRNSQLEQLDLSKYDIDELLDYYQTASTIPAYNATYPVSFRVVKRDGLGEIDASISSITLQADNEDTTQLVSPRSVYLLPPGRYRVSARYSVGIVGGRRIWQGWNDFEVTWRDHGEILILMDYIDM